MSTPIEDNGASKSWRNVLYGGTPNVRP